MRVVAGSARGRVLRAPPGRGTRPTSDRVREAVFSMLTSLGAVDGATVVDLFAGSGALGIEALSRGASRAIFVDHDAGAVDTIRANLGVLGPAGASATVVRADALAFASSVGRVDVCFADPPYAFAGWATLLDRLAGSGFAGLAVLEAGTDIDCSPGWDALRARRYGGTVVCVARPAPAGACLPRQTPTDKRSAG
jgi:16S rRNA (guanine966-N2)-methyltransferase